MKALKILLLCGYILPSLLCEARGIVGNFAILGEHSLVSQLYPHGVRTTVDQSSTSLQTECTVCDAGAPTEHCYEEFGECVALSNTVVSVIGTDGFLRGTPHPLDPSCTPRYLQRVEVGVVVVCHDPCFHLVTRTGSTFEVHPVECGTGQGGLVVEADFEGHPSLFLIELEGNHIFESNPFAAIPITDITPHINCTEYLSLHPLYTQENFMLRCNTTTGERVYIVNRSNRDDVPSVELSSAPISSPDGTTFAATTGPILELYRSNNLQDNVQQYPGVKDFGVDITLCTYLNSTTLLIGLKGGGQNFIHVERFIDNLGAGLTTLPYTSSNSRVHKLITQEVYATSNKIGTLYNILLFDISSGQALDPVSALLEEPVNIFFQHGMAPDPPPMTDLPLMTDQPPTSHPSPTTDHTISPALTSTWLIETHPITSEIPKPSPSDQFSKKLGDIVYIGVAVALILTVISIVVIMYFSIQYSKRRKSLRLTRPVEETDGEKGGALADATSIGGGPPANTSFFGGDGSSSGVGTAAQLFFVPNGDISSLGSSFRSSHNNFYIDPIPETQM